jgi:hypothetical protein
MAFNIINFQSELNQRGLAKTSHYDVDFTGLSDMPWTSGLNISRELSLRCEAAELPGRSITTLETRTYGPLRKIAYGQIYTDMTLTFIASQNLRERVLFEKWHEYMLGISEDNGLSNNMNTYNVQYYKNYTINLIVSQYQDAKNNIPTYRCRIFEAYPISMSAQQLQWGADEFQKIQVTFAYHHWKRMNWQDINNPSPSPSNALFNSAQLAILNTAIAQSGKVLSRDVAILAGQATKIPVLRNAVKNIF